MNPVLECLGHQLDAQESQPLEAKFKAIQEASTPTDLFERKFFWGMRNFCGKFMPNLSSILEPLHELLKIEICWKWRTEQQYVFQKAKNLLSILGVLKCFMILRKNWLDLSMRHPVA